ncbi:hypothetical protein RIF29_33473 [Crotalaria pallida]|uniref:DNA polymerase epsilon catalytic subunit n=1 Tax=Crotalaria pallida TaxID=3830 RepID=A0AAN9HWU4_CROPI
MLWFQQLINNLDRDLQYAIRVEGKMDLESVSNYDEVKDAIMEKPPSIVTDEVCTACDFNRPGKTCLRKLEWVWRGETFMAKKIDYYHVKKQIESEFVDGADDERPSKSFLDLPNETHFLLRAELFDKFLHGSTLEECYSAVASVANSWLDLLDNQGKDIADSELLDYISESSTMSKSLVDYGGQKSCAVTTARRLADFLGGEMVKDKGLRCQYIAASEPKGTPVSERAVPVAIFEIDAGRMKHFVRKWCKISSDVGIRSIIDWSYYKQRLSSAIQKIITIPTAMQKVANLVPRVVHPDWLHKKVREKEDKFRQRKLVDLFPKVSQDKLSKRHNDCDSIHLVKEEHIVNDLEDFGNKAKSSTFGPRPIIRHYEANNERHPVKINDQVDPDQRQNDNSSNDQPLSQQNDDDDDVFNDDGTLLELKGFEIMRLGELKLIKVFQVY